ncbi:MAG: hypothetical protein ACREFN_01475 [Acetobacteraceae bacterium]
MGDLLLELPGRFNLAMVCIVHDRAATRQISKRITMTMTNLRVLMERVAAMPSPLIRNDPDFGAPG